VVAFTLVRMRATSIRRSVVTTTAGLIFLIAGATPAFAHAEINLDQTKPRGGSTLNRAPSHVRLSFTEAPTKQASVTVTNACNEDAIKTVSVSDNDVHVFLKRPGEAGKYEVEFAVVSAVDGHPSRGKFAFIVSGEPDCSADPSPGDDDDDGNGDDGGVATPTPPADDSSFPIVPVAIGSGALIGIAFIARRLTAG
jgi:copper transport protein